MPKLTEQFSSWEEAIRNGRASEIADELNSVDIRHITRAERERLASFSYRVGSPLLGLRILARAVHSKTKVKPSALPEEVATYAACLLKIGASEEALSLLSTISTAKSSRGLFLLGAAYMTQWRYREAVPVLEAYVKRKDLSEYERLVGRVNLLAACIFCRRHPQAKALIRGLIADAGVRKLDLVRGNTFELAAQYYIQRKDWKEAKRYLSMARKTLKTRKTVDFFILRKWEALLAFQKDRDSTRLEELRAEAQARGHWETLRDCDRIEAIVTGSESILWRVYFGTTHAAYREELLANFRREVKAVVPPETYWQRIGPSSAKPRHELSLVGGTPSIEMTSLTRRVLIVLSSDRFAPLRIATLFEKLFPEERFNEETSLARVHQAVHRVRLWIEEAKLPLEIRETAGTYFLTAGESVSICVPGTRDLDASLPTMGRLRTATGGKDFSLGDVSRLGLSRRTLQRELNRLVEHKKLIRLGKGPSTKYQWKR